MCYNPKMHVGLKWRFDFCECFLVMENITKGIHSEGAIKVGELTDNNAKSVSV